MKTVATYTHRPWNKGKLYPHAAANEGLIDLSQNQESKGSPTPAWPYEA